MPLPLGFITGASVPRSSLRYSLFGNTFPKQERGPSKWVLVLKKLICNNVYGVGEGGGGGQGGHNSIPYWHGLLLWLIMKAGWHEQHTALFGRITYFI